MQLFYLHSLKTSWHNNLNCVFSASMLRNLTHNGGLSIYSFIQCGQWGEGTHLSLVWISKAVVSRIEDETMLLSVLYYNCINILSFSLSPIHSSYVAVSRPDVACRNLTTPPPPPPPLPRSLRWPAAFYHNWYSAKKICVVYWCWSEIWDGVKEFMLNAVKMVVKMVVPIVHPLLRNPGSARPWWKNK